MSNQHGNYSNAWEHGWWSKRDKLIFVENSGDVKPPKVESKSNIDGASVHVEASLYGDSGVVPLNAKAVDTTPFFFPEEVKWVRRQANKAGITIFIQISNVINPMLQLVCQRSGAHKVQEKNEAWDNRLKKMWVCVHCLWIS